MAEYVKQNEIPLNQVSKHLLVKMKVKPDDQSLYSLQLAKEALDRRKSGLIKMDVWDVDEMVEQLLQEGPAQAMQYLLENENGEVVSFSNLPEKDLKDLEPIELAQIILQSINIRMKAVTHTHDSA